MRYRHYDELDYELNIFQEFMMLSIIHKNFLWAKLYSPYSLVHCDSCVESPPEPIRIMVCTDVEVDGREKERIRENAKRAYYRTWQDTWIDVDVVSKDEYERQIEELEDNMHGEPVLSLSHGQRKFRWSVMYYTVLWERGDEIPLPKNFTPEKHLEIRRGDYV